MLRRLLQSVTFHPAFSLAVVLLLGPLDQCPLR
jgi:hypothetical protein